MPYFYATPLNSHLLNATITTPLCAPINRDDNGVFAGSPARICLAWQEISADHVLDTQRLAGEKKKRGVRLTVSHHRESWKEPLF